MSCYKLTPWVPADSMLTPCIDTGFPHIKPLLRKAATLIFSTCGRTWVGLKPLPLFSAIVNRRSATEKPLGTVCNSSYSRQAIGNSDLCPKSMPGLAVSLFQSLRYLAVYNWRLTVCWAHALVRASDRSAEGRGFFSLVSHGSYYYRTRAMVNWLYPVESLSPIAARMASLNILNPDQHNTDINHKGLSFTSKVQTKISHLIKLLLHLHLWCLTY